MTPDFSLCLTYTEQIALDYLDTFPLIVSPHDGRPEVERARQLCSKLNCGTLSVLTLCRRSWGGAKLANGIVDGIGGV